MITLMKFSEMPAERFLEKLQLGIHKDMDYVVKMSASSGSAAFEEFAEVYALLIQHGILVRDTLSDKDTYYAFRFRRSVVIFFQDRQSYLERDDFAKIDVESGIISYLVLKGVLVRREKNG